MRARFQAVGADDGTSRNEKARASVLMVPKAGLFSRVRSRASRHFFLATGATVFFLIFGLVSKMRTTPFLPPGTAPPIRTRFWSR